MLDRQVTLSISTVLSLIHAREAEPHAVLGTEHTWHNTEAIDERDRRANRELLEVGLRDETGTDPGLNATIAAIAHPSLEYYGWITAGHEGGSSQYAVLAGIGMGEAFLIGRNSDTGVAVLSTVHPNALMQRFIAELPALRPGDGQQIQAPQSEVTGRDAGGDEVTILRGNRPNAGSTQAAELKRILGLHRFGGGTLYVAARNRSGTRKRAAQPLNYIDTDEGRWFTEKAPGPGEPVVWCTPATPQLFADRLQRSRKSLGC